MNLTSLYSVDWFFHNGAVVYRQRNESNPSVVQKNGSNLPQCGSNDDALDIQYYSGNKLVVYALLHGHASYPKLGCVLLGSGGVDIGVRDDTTKSDKMMDTRVKAVVIAKKYMELAVVEPPWLNYERKWSPKFDYDVDKEMNKVRVLKFMGS
ncbi:hypothetical protein L2E82_02913 [Cichorium intybus]|uniref:Uncharacterized protein n=1 Tax=Cichorium intybus TaxID=13427 RepID=A0ACB9H339_CICIN|nr:hypothetical protein L2E82_02913 [Cichorium intybus]